MRNLEEAKNAFLSEMKKEFSVNTQNSSIIKHYICYPHACMQE